MALTKADIIGRMCERNGISKTDAVNVVETAFEVIKGSLERGEKVQIRNFGKFSVHSKAERVGRNPLTGDEIIIPAHKSLIFKPSAEIKKKLNKHDLNQSGRIS